MENKNKIWHAFLYPIIHLFFTQDSALSSLIGYYPNHLCHINAIVELQNIYLHIHIF